MARQEKLTVKDIEQWIANDEGLYLWQRRSGLNQRAFIKKHREEIEKVINNVTTSKRPAHYLVYGG
jgi:hypothetical protein